MNMSQNLFGILGDLTPYLYKTRVKGETIESKDAIEHAKKVAEQEEEDRLMQIKKEEEVNKQGDF